MVTLFRGGHGDDAPSGSFSERSAGGVLTPSSPFIVGRTCSSVEAGLLFVRGNRGYPVFIIADPATGGNGAVGDVGLTISFTRVNGEALLVSDSVEGPAVREVFSVPIGGNLSRVLTKLASGVAISGARVRGLSILANNGVPPGPTRLLTSSEVSGLLRFIGRRCSYIFVSAPPMGLIASTAIFSRGAANCVVVIGSGTGSSTSIGATISDLSDVNNGVLNFVLGSIASNGGGCCSCCEGCNCGCGCSCNCKRGWAPRGGRAELHWW